MYESGNKLNIICSSDLLMNTISLYLPQLHPIKTRCSWEDHCALDNRHHCSEVRQHKTCTKCSAQHFCLLPHTCPDQTRETRLYSCAISQVAHHFITITKPTTAGRLKINVNAYTEGFCIIVSFINFSFSSSTCIHKS